MVYEEMRALAGVLLLALVETNCGRSAQTYLAHGNALYNSGKYAEAEFQYRASVAKDRGFAEAYYRLGLAESQLGRDDTALAAYERAGALAPANDQYQVAIADLCVEALRADGSANRFYDRLSRIADGFLGKNPNSFDGLRLRGELLIIDRRYDEAVAELRKASAVRPFDAKIYFPMVQALLGQDRAAEAASVVEAMSPTADAAGTYELLVDYYSSHGQVADVERLLRSEVAALPRLIEPRLNLAGFYESSGRQKEMAGILEGIQQDRAHFAHAPAALGDFYAGGGHWDDALREFRDGERSDPSESQRYQKGIARALAAEGRTSDALAELNLVLSKHADDAPARLARAILLLDSPRSTDRDLAVGDLKSLATSVPDDASVTYELGLAYAANGDRTSAAKELKKAAELRPDDPAPRLALAEVAQNTGNYAEAVSLTGRILAEDSNNREAAILHARALVSKGDYSRARTVLDGFRKSAQSNDVNLLLASLDAAQKKYASADEILARELRNTPNSANAHLLAALTAREEGKPAVAIQHYEWLLANNPPSADVLESVGRLYADQGDLHRAIASYQKASELAPRDANALAQLAVLQNDAGDLTAAIATLKKQLALQPDDPTTMNNLAFDFAEMGTELDGALAFASAAARKLGDNPEVLDTLGWVYTKKGLNNSALQVYRVLVKRAPDLGAYHYHYGVALMQSHLPDQAKSEFAAALSKKLTPGLAERIKQIGARL